jgi:hypothetical protein
MPHSPAQPALLHLVKVHGQPAEQTREAAKILGVDLEEINDSLETAPYLPSTVPRQFAPKEEWILRWLLTRLRVDEDRSLECAGLQ